MAKHPKTGTLAELNDYLNKKGYYYQYKSGQKSYSETGRAVHMNAQGEKVLMKRIARGEGRKWYPRPEGAKSWLASTGGKPDTWKLFKLRRRH